MGQTWGCTKSIPSISEVSPPYLLELKPSQVKKIEKTVVVKQLAQTLHIPHAQESEHLHTSKPWRCQFQITRLACSETVRPISVKAPHGKGGPSPTDVKSPKAFSQYLQSIWWSEMPSQHPFLSAALTAIFGGERMTPSCWIFWKWDE